MRRTSFVAPLLLIAIGGLFLARNIYPEMPLSIWVSRYWPLILIVWGLLRIVEIGTGRRGRSHCRHAGFRAASGC